LPELPNSCRGSFFAKGAPSWIALLYDRSFVDLSFLSWIGRLSLSDFS
jgi:hypothetical protein